MTDATWTILIATLAQRSQRLNRVLGQLLPQTEPYDGRVQVCALYNKGERPLGEVRQDLIESATSDYVSFVDDDDELPEYYVSEIVPLLGSVDYVGWRMQCFIDGVKMKPTFHSLRYKKWSEDRKGYYRDVSHLNPIRTTLAQKVDYRTVPAPEDYGWSLKVRRYLRSEAYVDRVMYFYHSSSSDTTWRGGRIRRVRGLRPTISHPNFSYHPRSSD